MGDIHAEYRLAKIYLFESDYFDWQKAVEYLNPAAHKGNENGLSGIAEHEPEHGDLHHHRHCRPGRQSVSHV